MIYINEDDVTHAWSNLGFKYFPSIMRSLPQCVIMLISNFTYLLSTAV